MNRILIVRTCAVGDFVLNLPALQALQIAEPNAAFTLIGAVPALALARDFIRVEAIHSIEAEPWRRLFYEPIPALDYSRTIVWMKDPAVARNLKASGLKNVQSANPFPTGMHAATHLLNTLGLTAPPFQDRWNPSSKQVVLHPGSGSRQKCWPHFLELAGRLENPVFLIGPAEAGFDTGGYPYIENLELPAVAALIASSAAFVGNDSGITHLSAYLGCPTTALFGPTDPAIWAPIGLRVRILHKPVLESIGIDDVLGSIEKRKAL